MISAITTTNQLQLQLVSSHKRLTFKSEQLTRSEDDCFVKNDIQPQPTKRQSTIERQIHSPLDVFLTLATFGALGGFILYALRNRKSKPFLNDKSSIEFTSLRNDLKVPNLETCKSINKNLREILENQLKLSSCNQKILEESGFPQNNKAFLLSGSPGNGKTFYSKIYAKSMDAEYMELSFQIYSLDGLVKQKKI